MSDRNDASKLSFPCWPPELPEIAESVGQIIRSGQWGRYRSEARDAFAERLAHEFGVDHVTLCASGTCALDYALAAAGISGQCEVIVAGYDFPGNIRAVQQRDVAPVLVDVEPHRFVINPEQVRAAISPQTRCILGSHLYGNLANAKELRSIADQHDLTFIEDACQAHGAICDGKPAGSWGHIGLLSFGGSKLMTSGAGGALLTNDPRIAGKATLIAERPSAVAPLGALQVAALRPQLDLLPQWNQRRLDARNHLAARLEGSQLWGLPELLPHESRTAFYKLPWLIPDRIDLETLLQTCIGRAIPVGPGFVSYLRRATKHYRTVGDLPHSRQCFQRSFLLEHRALLGSVDQLDRLCDELLKIEETTNR